MEAVLALVIASVITVAVARSLSAALRAESSAGASIETDLAAGARVSRHYLGIEALNGEEDETLEGARKISWEKIVVTAPERPGSRAAVEIRREARQASFQ